MLRFFMRALGLLLRTVRDNVRAIGTVRVTKVFLDGRSELLCEKNLVVDTGKTMLAKLLGGGYAGGSVDTIAFGVGTTAAAGADTALGSEQFTKAAVVTYPAFNQVTFTATMEAAEGGTNTYTELGLKATGGDLFSRVIIPAIVKSTLYKIKVDWTISFQS